MAKLTEAQFDRRLVSLQKRTMKLTAELKKVLAEVTDLKKLSKKRTKKS